MKISVLKKSNFANRGSDVLKDLQDNETPGLDLLVREGIQNSTDQIKYGEHFCQTNFYFPTFEIGSLCNWISCDDPIVLKIANKYYPNTSVASALVLADTHTKGLLGEPYEQSNHDNNLHNLVYDIRRGNTAESAGGSWGIGKSVYYRYGRGLVFYYSRTFENQQYHEKLAGVFLENETKSDCLLGPNKSGICFIGNEMNHDGETIPCPIFDSATIRSFLFIFGIKPYSGDETGTTIIIPFLDFDKILGQEINKSESKSWSTDLYRSLEISIQRWWFPRLNNAFFKKPYLRAFVGPHQVTLNPFFQTLQDIYNGNVDKGVGIEKIKSRGIDCDDTLGELHYLQGDSSTFDVDFNPPDNYPSAYALVDIENEKVGKHPAIFCYCRDHGMIICYDASSKYLNNLIFDNSHYLLAMFICNERAQIKGTDETLGGYFRGTEKANHKSWADSKLDEFPVLSKADPFTRIMRDVRNKLEDKFCVREAPVDNGVSTKLRRKLGNLLLPPKDFGNEPTLPEKPTRGEQQPGAKKKRPVSFALNSFSDGRVIYDIALFLESGEKKQVLLNVVTGTTKCSFLEWHNLGFEIPFAIEKVVICSLTIKGEKKEKKFVISCDKITSPNFHFRNDKNSTDDFLVSIISTVGSVEGFEIQNLNESPLTLEIQVVINPFNLAYQFDFVTKTVEAVK